MKHPIGIFDSGYGGLTVLKSIREKLPKYDYLIGEILNQNKSSTISFIKDKDPYCTLKFMNRLKN